MYSEFLNGNYAVNVFLQPTHQEELMKVAKNLKTKSSQGFDNLSTFIIQQTLKEVAAPLTHIFNQSFLMEVVPDQMEIAKIVPVFNAGNKKILNNYRPISILPAFSKILEKRKYSYNKLSWIKSKDITLAIFFRHVEGIWHHKPRHPNTHTWALWHTWNLQRMVCKLPNKPFPIYGNKWTKIYIFKY